MIGGLLADMGRGRDRRAKKQRKAAMHPMMMMMPQAQMPAPDSSSSDENEAAAAAPASGASSSAAREPAAAAEKISPSVTCLRQLSRKHLMEMLESLNGSFDRMWFSELSHKGFCALLYIFTKAKPATKICDLGHLPA